MFWSQNVHEIIPRLYLGNYKAALDKQFIKENNINVIINCTPDYPFIYDTVTQTELELLPKFESMRIPVKDSQLEKDFLLMEFYMKVALPFLVQKYKSHDKILIHCHAGKQRSCILVAALLKVLLDTNVIEISSIPKSINPKSQFFQIVQYIIYKRPQAFTYGFKINFRKTYERFFCLN